MSTYFMNQQEILSLEVAENVGSHKKLISKQTNKSLPHFL